MKDLYKAAKRGLIYSMHDDPIGKHASISCLFAVMLASYSFFFTSCCHAQGCCADHHLQAFIQYCEQDLRSRRLVVVVDAVGLPGGAGREGLGSRTRQGG